MPNEALALMRIRTAIDQRVLPSPEDLKALDDAAAFIEEFARVNGRPNNADALPVPSINSGQEVEDAMRVAARFLMINSYLLRTINGYRNAPDNEKSEILDLLVGGNGAPALRQLRAHLEALAASRAVKDPSGGGIPAPSYDMIGSLKSLHEKLDAIIARLL